MAVSLKNVFDGVKEENGVASAILVARGVRDIKELEKFSESIEDLGIIHNKLTFDEVLEICCSGAFQPQINTIKEWLAAWEQRKINKTQKTQVVMRNSSRSFKTYTQLFADKHSNRS